MVTALLFGASGAVGSQVFNALSDNPFWDEIILVGRRFPETTDTRVSKVEFPDLSKIDEDENALQLKADACIIAVGVGDPQDRDMNYWHSIDVDMMASIARLCDKIGARYISLLSAVTSHDDPIEFSPEKDLNDKGQGPIGWWKMVANYDRMKGLSEKAVITASNSVSHVHIFRPCTIVTEDTRYGWVDTIIFKMHSVLDPIFPAHYRSIKAKSLGMAFSSDAVNMLQESESADTSSNDSSRVKKFFHDDFVRIIGSEINTTGQGSETAGKGDEI